MKEAYERENYPENGRGSSLLTQARTGSLLTNQRRNKYMAVENRCSLCGREGDTGKHIVLECQALENYRQNWQWPEGWQEWTEMDRFGYRLGFWVQGGILDREGLQRTKELLVQWEKLCRAENA
jgi:hypothetical protein